MSRTGGDARSLGERVRQLRTDQAMTLASLSQRCGVSVSTLSKLENGQTGVSLDNVIRLAAAFEMPVSILINEAGPASGTYSVARANDPYSHDVEHLDFKVLHDDLPGQRNIFWQVRVKSHSLKHFGPLHSHPGEEFFYVLSGRVELILDGHETILLAPGDSVQFDSAIAHAYISRSRADAHILMSNTITDHKPAGYVEVRASAHHRTQSNTAAAARTTSAASRRAPSSSARSRKKKP